jgi:hypothetical protein
MPTDRREKAPTNYDLGYERCVVTFIDILGYRALLNEKHADDIVKIVRALRRFVRGDSDDKAPPTRMDEVRVITQSFSESVSDAVVRVRTIETQRRYSAFFIELYDLMFATIACVNQGILIRGGMTIGPVHVGLDGRGPIFGKAMVRAYEIESSEAIYPRIMIDEDALNAYAEDESLWDDGGFHPAEAKAVKKFIGTAEDGSYFLDYLNSAEPEHFDDLLAGQIKFLRNHRDLIKKGLNSNDRKVRRKMAWLANYHNRSIATLRKQYDPDHWGHRAREMNQFGTPSDEFDALVVEETWTSGFHRLTRIANGEAVHEDEL